LLAAADRYRVERLKLICEGKLSGGIDADTAAATLALAELHGCEQLKAKCIDFIVRSPAVLDSVLATEGYKNLEASCPSVGAAFPAVPRPSGHHPNVHLLLAIRGSGLGISISYSV
jgi:hypothetical protein